MSSKISVLAIFAVGLLTACASGSEREPVMRPAAGDAAPRLEPLGPSVLSARFVNRLPTQYRLTEVTCELDGVTLCDLNGDVATRYPLFSRKLPPGAHLLLITAAYAGNAGVFSYMSGFHYVVRSSTHVDVDESRPSTAMIQVYERGGPTDPIIDRLRMLIREE